MSGGVQHPHTKIAERILAMTALAAAGCLWGTGFLFAKIAFREMGVVANVSLRFLFGSVVLAPMFFRKTRKFRRRDFWLMVLANFVGIPLQFLIQFKGVSLTTGSHASLMVSTLPVLLALTSTIFLRERLRPGEWIILFLSTIGAVLISVSKTADGPQASLKGDLMVVLSMIAAVVLALLTKRLMHDYDPLYVTASMIVAGTLLLLICLAFEHPRLHYSAKAWLALVAQGVLATALAFMLWNWGMARVPAARAGIFFNLEPLVGTVLAVSFLPEKLGGIAVIGGVMILWGAAYFSTRKGLNQTQHPNSNILSPPSNGTFA